MRTLIAAMLVLVACHSPTAPLAGVTVTTSASVVTGAGQLFAIATTITNDSRRPITIEGNRCPARFRVESEAGEPVPLPGQICALYSIQVTLVPGASYRFNDQWDGKNSSGIRLSGTYRIIGQPFAEYGPQSVPVSVQLP